MAREGRAGLILQAAAAAVAAALVSLTSSCAGAPAARAAPEPLFSSLGMGATAYAVCDVAALRPILEAAAPKLREDRRAGDLLDRTRSAAIALYGGPGFRLVARGDYPRFLTSLSLTLKRSWKRIGGEYPHWQSNAGLRLAFRDDGSVFLSDAAPTHGYPPGPGTPPSFDSLDPDVALRAFFPEPAALVSRALGPAGELIRLPLSELVLSLSAPGDGTYEALLIATAPGEREARALASLLRLARFAVSSEDPDPRRRFVGKILGSTARLDGARLHLIVEGLDAKDLASLFPAASGALLWP